MRSYVVRAANAKFVAIESRVGGPVRTLSNLASKRNLADPRRCRENALQFGQSDGVFR